MTNSNLAKMRKEYETKLLIKVSHAKSQITTILNIRSNGSANFRGAIFNTIYNKVY